ncbi:MAG TPA: lysophospholipid acyltransferase, partial [Acidimicrobiia bacterium]|nr:lysophospholipid acyltransferase [Acidimicrobiia bacterium]
DGIVRAGGSVLVQRVPALAGRDRALPTDAEEVGQLLADDAFADGVGRLAEKLGRDEGSVRAEAAGYLREMSGDHTDRSCELWQKFGNWMLRGYDQLLDEEGLARLRHLDRKHTLVFLISHRSYLDGWTMGPQLPALGFSPTFVLGGSNANVFPISVVSRNSGVVWIRRSTDGLPVYRFALRAYIEQILRNRKNLWWSIEGGRTRTGKLRPPRYGLLKYVVDAVAASDGPEVLLVPVSNVYDQLHEVRSVTAEARGGVKRPETAVWFARYAANLGQRMGRVYVDFGEPLRLRERLAELEAEGADRIVERVALDVSHRLNRATPVTPTAAVCVAMLAADRALSLSEVLATVAPLADYLSRRGWPIAGAATLTDAMTVRRALQDLVSSGVLTSYSGGDETVWAVGPDQHLTAAFYRNGAIHTLVVRAIAELTLLSMADGEPAGADEAAGEALRLRELLKFEFFFSGRSEFRTEIEAELALIHPDTTLDGGPEEALGWLRSARLRVAHLVLRPYLEAYWLVAHQLAALDEEGFDEQRFLTDCLRVGRQWALQRRLASEESVTLELFRGALELARHRDLLVSDDPNLNKRREVLAEELRAAVTGTAAIAEMERA